MIALTECNVKSRKCAYPYSSLQFNFPKFATKKIIQWGEDNISDDMLYEEENNLVYGREYESHVTINYGITDDNPKNIKKLLGKQKPFYIECGKLSVFNCDKFDVLKIEVESPELRRINKMVSDSIDIIPSNFNVYRPHATIAFLKKNIGDRFVGNSDFVGNRVLVDRLMFSSKDSTQSTIEFNYV